MFDEIFKSDKSGKKYKFSDPYKYDKRYKKGTLIFLIIIFLVFFIPLFLNNKNRYIVPITPNEANVTQGATLKKVHSIYNPNTHLMVTSFFIGDQTDIDNTAEDKNLANLEYKIKYQIKRQKVVKLPTKIVRVNDHFIVFETQNVVPDFGILEYDITPQKINSDLDTDCESDTITNYVQESTVSKSTNLVVQNPAYYQQLYKKFAISNYQKKISKFYHSIANKRKIIKEDNTMLTRLNYKLATAFREDKSNLQDQINETEQDIDQQKKEIKDTQDRVKVYQDRINHVAMTNQN